MHICESPINAELCRFLSNIYWWKCLIGEGLTYFTSLTSLPAVATCHPLKILRPLWNVKYEKEDGKTLSISNPTSKENSNTLHFKNNSNWSPHSLDAYSVFEIRSDVTERYTRHCPKLYHFKAQWNFPISTFDMLSLFYINWILSIFLVLKIITFCVYLYPHFAQHPNFLEVGL